LRKAILTFVQVSPIQLMRLLESADDDEQESGTLEKKARNLQVSFVHFLEQLQSNSFFPVAAAKCR
jgi:hypothetical protein